jgi:polysaccharide pyruvyl transferase WcaK-like protein
MITANSIFWRRQWRRLCRIAGYDRAIRHRPNGRIEVILLGGFGYGNTGDEAQLGTNLRHWRTAHPEANLTVLSPNPIYTSQLHDVACIQASRVIFFKSDIDLHYKQSDCFFKRRFFGVFLRMMLNVRLMRAGFAPIFSSAEEAALLLKLHCADVVHVSGGGFLTGMTRSRLWDTSLVLMICHALGTPYFLTGQSVGIFQTWADRWLAKKALSGATSISLRDAEHSMDELLTLGIPENILHSSVDDALFCDQAAPADISKLLAESGINAEQPYVCVNYHFREMSEAMQKACTARLAGLLDQLTKKSGVQILFVPMHKVDEPAEQSVIKHMQQPSQLFIYPYDYRMVRAAIAGAECLISFKHHPLIFALAEGVPCLSISLDEYYRRKNHGAMQHLEQQQYCVHGDVFFEENAEKLLHQLYTERDEISAALKKRISSLREAHERYIRPLFASLPKQV